MIHATRGAPVCESVVWFSSSAAIIHYIRFSFSVKSTAELGTRRASPLAAHIRRQSRIAGTQRHCSAQPLPTKASVTERGPDSADCLIRSHEHHSHCTSVVHAVFEPFHRSSPGRPIETKGRRGDLTIKRLLLSSSSTRRPGLPWHPWLFLGWSRSPFLNAAASPHERGRLHRVHSCPRALCLLHP